MWPIPKCVTQCICTFLCSDLVTTNVHHTIQPLLRLSALFPNLYWIHRNVFNIIFCYFFLLLSLRFGFRLHKGHRSCHVATLRSKNGSHKLKLKLNPTRNWPTTTTTQEQHNSRTYYTHAPRSIYEISFSKLHSRMDGWACGGGGGGLAPVCLSLLLLLFWYHRVCVVFLWYLLLWMTSFCLSMFGFGLWHIYPHTPGALHIIP